MGGYTYESLLFGIIFIGSNLSKLYYVVYIKNIINNIINIFGNDYYGDYFFY